VNVNTLYKVFYTY